MEPVYRSIEIAADRRRARWGPRSPTPPENIPEHGGAVIAMNHISYIDYLPAGSATRAAAPPNPLHAQGRSAGTRRCRLGDQAHRLHPVDRLAGAGALRRGRAPVAGRSTGRVFPKRPSVAASNSREFKTGAVRMALEAQAVPIVPLIIWGSQRMWTRRSSEEPGRRRIPWIVRAGDSDSAARHDGRTRRGTARVDDRDPA